MISSAKDVLDEALDLLSPYSPDLKSGLTSHATMVAEALCELGRPTEVLPWVRNYLEGMEQKSFPRKKIEEKDWASALGDVDRYSDWLQFFRNEAAGSDWKSLLEIWVDRLAPGFCSDATHGVIRLGHAVRSLSRSDTKARREEFLEALARWSSSYQTLPETDSDSSRALRPAEAILRVPLVPQESRKYEGTIVGSLKDLQNDSAFARTIGFVDLGGEVELAVSELTLTFADVFLANAKDFLTCIVFIHGVTSIVALRHLLPYLGEEARRKTLRYAWQSSSALLAAFGSDLKWKGNPPSFLPEKEELIDAAIRSGDEHAIKFTEACFREYSIVSDPRFLFAAGKAIQLLTNGTFQEK